MSEISQYTESLHEECGVFGMYDKTGGTDMVSAVYSALYALQHRGQESCGIALNVDGVLSGYRDLGLVSEVFTKRVLEELPRGAKMATGHVRYATAGQRSRSNAQPMVLHHCKGAMAVCHNGNLVNAPKLRRKLEMSGSIFHGTSDTEVIAYLLTQNRLLTPNIEMAVSRTMDDIEGAYSLVIMTHTKLIAARDPNGFRPLCIGELPDGNGYAFASESCALDAVGAKFVRDVRPGEIVIADRNGLRTMEDHCGTAPHTMCVFEYIYFARPDSVIEGIPRAVHLDEHGLGDLTGQFQNGCGAAGFPFDCGDAVVGLGHSAGQALTELDLAELHAFGQRRAVNHGDFDLRFAGRLEHGEELVDALDRRVAPFVLLAAGLRVVACVERAHGMVHGGRHGGRNRVRVVGVGDRNLDFLDGCCVVGHRNQPTDPSIWSSTSLLSSSAYSIGSSRLIGSTKPRTIMPRASSSVSPRLIR